MEFRFGLYLFFRKMTHPLKSGKKGILLWGAQMFKKSQDGLKAPRGAVELSTFDLGEHVIPSTSLTNRTTRKNWLVACCLGNWDPQKVKRLLRRTKDKPSRHQRSMGERSGFSLERKKRAGA